MIDQGRSFDAVSRDYYLGGLDDMAAWTSLVWEQAAVALSGGTQVRLLLELNTKPIHDPPPAIGQRHPPQHPRIVLQWDRPDGVGVSDDEQERCQQAPQISRPTPPTYP